MDQDLFNKLHAEGIISEASFDRTEQRRTLGLFSVHLEIKLLFYLGILMLTTGLGILIYKNIDSIGHQAILAFIAVIVIGCSFYCFKHKAPYSKDKVESPTGLFDLVLLLGTLSFLIFIGYLQYQYNVFGNNYGMATFIPMLVLFYIAYNFDHIGILNLGITNLGIWMGVSVTPRKLLLEGTFNSGPVIYTYLGFGILLLVLALITQRYAIKKHFKFSYLHYGVHVTFISLLAGYFFYYSNDLSLLWLVGVFLLGFIIYRDALKQRSFYFLLLVVLYCYVASSCLLARFIIDINPAGIYLMLMYFVSSSIGLVLLLINLNKKLKEI